MQAVTGIFRTRAEAEHAAGRLLAAGVPREGISLLTPGTAERVAEVPTTEAEAPGVATAIGTVAGGAAGAAGGIFAGTLVGLAVPGVGPVLAMGLLGAALMGAGGAAIGAAFDETMQHGLPKDEVYVYEDALRRGRSVVIALAEDLAQAAPARAALDAAGAESLDAAREQWWTGLRDVEASRYTAPGRFAADEPYFRRGFEAALSAGRRGRRFDEVAAELRARHPDMAGHPAFRRGYERGRAWASEPGRRSSRAA